MVPIPEIMTHRLPEIMAAWTRSRNHDRRTPKTPLQTNTWAGGAHKVNASEAQGPDLAPGGPYTKGGGDVDGGPEFPIYGDHESTPLNYL